MRAKITKRRVDATEPAGKDVLVWDTELKGFGLKVTPAGQKSYLLQYRMGGRGTPTQRVKIGRHGIEVTADQARDAAIRLRGLISQGIDPAKERKKATAELKADAEARKRDTVGAAIELYLSRYAKRNLKPSTYAEVSRTLLRDVSGPLGRWPIREITRRDAAKLLDDIVDRGSPSHANHVLAYFRAMLNWAVDREMIPGNPIARMKAPSVAVTRDRALDDDESKVFWSACDHLGWPFGPLLKLLLLTGQRRDEVAGMRWTELDLDKQTWTLPRERAKNDKEHIVHLSALVIEVVEELPRLNDQLVFTTNGSMSRKATRDTTKAERPVSGFGRAKDRLDAKMLELLKTELGEAGKAKEAEAAHIAPFTIHDLRRTAATGMARLNIAPHIVDKILNHVGGSIEGVAAIYNRHAYLEERKAALDTWSRHVEGLIRPQPLNVVQMRRRVEA
jgi:integrase